MHLRRGQATVEAALTVPLALFLVLGGLQVLLSMQARLMAQYAVARATKVGAANFGDCERMTHAAILALLPSFVTYLGPGTPGATKEDKLANAFAARRSNRYAGSGTVRDGSPDMGYDGPVVWIMRERPLAREIRALGQDPAFDMPGKDTRLEVRMVYWFPLRIPFADWVIARAVLAQWGVEDYTAANPLLTGGDARWTASGGYNPDAAIKSEMRRLAVMKQYTLPITVSYTTRMMTPADAQFFARQNCLPAP